MSYIIILMRSLFNHYINQLNLSNIQIEAISALTNVLFEDAASTAKHKTKRVISEVLPQKGKEQTDLCPPYDKKELMSRGYIPLKDVQQMLDDGVDLSEYMTQKEMIRINNKYNVVRDGKLISNKWFDGAGDFHSGYAPVKLKDKWNFIDTNGNFLSDQWFDIVGFFGDDFGDEFAPVYLNGKGNYIDINGDFLCEQWFDAE